MNKFSVFLTLAVVGLAAAEPPVSTGYAYSGPSISHGSHSTSIISSGLGGHGGGLSLGGGGYSLGGGGGGYSLGGGSYHSGGDIGGISGPYHSVPIGYQTHEGQHVDSVLLHKVKNILVDHENQEAAQFGGHFGGGHGGHGGHGGLSLSYGAPSHTYGVPHYGGRVVGIELGHITPGIQVAQYHQSGHIGYPSGSYGVPSGSYGVPSGSYGVPHH